MSFTANELRSCLGSIAILGATPTLAETALGLDSYLLDRAIGDVSICGITVAVDHRFAPQIAKLYSDRGFDVAVQADTPRAQLIEISWKTK